jgi:hypothetical protein
MVAMGIVILPEARQFSLQVVGIPEERLIKKLTTDGSNQPFDKAMGLTSASQVMSSVV